MYVLTMASIVKKIIRGKPYFYARECKRIDGKPKIIWQKYLGRADDIVAAVSRSDSASTAVAQPTEAVVAEFGAVAALLDLARRLRLVEHIDRHVPKDGHGPSVGTYLLVSVLNRCLAPTSKAGIGHWFQKTALRRLLDVQAGQLTSQRFWDNMDRVSPSCIEAIERDLTSHLVREFNIDLRRVLFDATNFFTFIDTFNERSNLAQRGKSKEGRKSLRIVGLALLVSADFHIPLLHHTYPGNQTDSPTFASLTTELVTRYHQIMLGAEHVTIVFDKGNNSADNLRAVADSPYHFIGSLVPTQHVDLLQVPASQMRSLQDDDLPEVSCFRTRKKVFGAERTVLVTYNENLFIAQSQTLLREIAKRQARLRELQAQLRRRRQGKVTGGKPPTAASVRKKIDDWLKARHMKDLFRITIAEQHGLPILTWQFDKHAWDNLQRTLLGKTLLFTDNDGWSDADIVRGYRSQHHVETAFRCMKDPLHIALRPQFHWTDQKIQVHVFCCVLALTLCSLLQRVTHEHGLGGSIRDLLDDLADIREVGVLFAGKDARSKPAIRTTLSAMHERQRALYDALGLQRYLAA
jgi:transposase